MKKYTKYKPSGVEWIGEIPEEWDLKKLKYEAKIQGGYAFKSEYFVDDGTPIVRIGDIASSIDLEGCKKTSESNIPIEFKLNKYDTLIALSGATVGKMCFINEDLEAYINQRVARVNNQSKCLHYFLNSEFFVEQILLAAGGSAQENISTNTIGNFFIPIPTQPEQIAIANYLDDKTAKIDTLIEKKKKLIELLKEERTAVINHYVLGKHLLIDNGELTMDNSQLSIMNCKLPKHWEVKKLKYVAKLRDELIDDSDFKIAVENIESGTGKLVGMEEDKNYQGKLSAFKNGDTVFNKLRPYLHKVYYAEQDGGLFGELLMSPV